MLSSDRGVNVWWWLFCLLVAFGLGLAVGVAGAGAGASATGLVPEVLAAGVGFRGPAPVALFGLGTPAAPGRSVGMPDSEWVTPAVVVAPGPDHCQLGEFYFEGLDDPLCVAVCGRVGSCWRVCWDVVPVVARLGGQ